VKVQRRNTGDLLPLHELVEIDLERRLAEPRHRRETAIALDPDRDISELAAFEVDGRMHVLELDAAIPGDAIPPPRLCDEADRRS
jgi:hypothetical protein